jgi:hypothetical protein
MTAFAFSREWLRILGKFRLGGWARGTSDRGGQDKSRKVRTVGRLGNVSNFNHAPNIAKNWHTLPILPGRCSCSAFDTLRRAI